MPREITGDKLNAQDKQHVLRVYTNRYTSDHMPSWAKGTRHKPHFRSDDEWLKRTRFKVRKDGGLDNRCRFVSSSPTFPFGR